MAQTKEFDRPQDIEAEQVVLGCIISDTDALPLAVELLKPAHFYRDLHRTMFEVCLDLYQNDIPANEATICGALNDKHLPESVDIVRYIGKLIEVFIETRTISDDIPIYAKRLKDKYGDRQVMDISEALVVAAHQGDKAAIAQAQRQLADISSERLANSELDLLNEIVPGALDDIEANFKVRGQLTGVTSGFSDLDRMTIGFQKGDLIILAGRPGLGKTSLAMTVAYYAAKSGKLVAVFSMEMRKKQLVHRLISMRSGVSSNMLRSGWIEEDEWPKIAAAGDELAELPLAIDDMAASPLSTIETKLRKLQRKAGRPVDLVIVDYIGLMGSETGKDENRVQEVSRFSRGLKQIASKFDVPVLALSQLNRNLEQRADKTPKLSDLKESGSVEQDADIVLFVHREEMYDPNSLQKGIASLIVAKHRNGPTGEVALYFDAKRTTFHDLEATPGLEPDEEEYMEA